MTRTVLKRIASGDRTAVQDCFDNYGGLVWSLAKKMLPIGEDAEDAVQEIFIEIWKNADRFDESKSSETTFIAMIARRRLIDRIRKFSRRPGIDSLEDILIEPTGNDANRIYNSIEAKQALEAMAVLKSEQRNVLILSIVHGYSHSEISKALNLPLGTVKTHARRGLLLVRGALKKRGFDQRKGASA